MPVAPGRGSPSRRIGGRARCPDGHIAYDLRHPWAELLKRVVTVDVLCCHRCGGRREVLALISDWIVVRAILECLGLPAEAPVVHPARGPRSLF